MLTPYATEKRVFGKVRNRELASVEYAVSADLSRPLSSAFALTVTLRVFGKSLGQTTVDPIANGPLAVTVGEPVGYQIKGRIDKWGPIDASGVPVAPSRESWDTAASASFIVVAIEDTAVPLSTLLAPLTFVNRPLAFAASLIGDNIKLNIGHKRPIILPIYRDHTGRCIQPPAPLATEHLETEPPSPSSEGSDSRTGLVKARLGAFAAATQAALRVGPRFAQPATPERTVQFTPAEQARIASALAERNVSSDCLSCASEDTRAPLSVIVSMPTAPDMAGIPMIATACRSCGSIELHAVDGLGLTDLASRFERG